MAKRKKQNEIETRRQEILKLRIDHTIVEIAEILGVSPSIINLDIAVIKEGLRIWIASLPKETIPLDYKDMIESTKHIIADLKDKYEKSTDDWLKLAVSKEIRENQKHLQNLYDGYPAIYAMRNSGDSDVQKN